MDILCDKGRFLIKDISLNKLFYFNKNHIKEDKKNSENFQKGSRTKIRYGQWTQKNFERIS